MWYTITWWQLELEQQQHTLVGLISMVAHSTALLPTPAHAPMPLTSSTAYLPPTLLCHQQVQLLVQCTTSMYPQPWMSQWSYVIFCHLYMFNTSCLTSTSLSYQWVEWLGDTTCHYMMLMCVQLHSACHLTCQWQGWWWTYNNNGEVHSCICTTQLNDDTDMCPMCLHFDMTCNEKVTMTVTWWLWLNKDGMTKMP